MRILTAGSDGPLIRKDNTLKGLPSAGPPARVFTGPIAYADAALETVFYVESDGRHVSAIGFDGKVLWTRDPFSEAKLEAYRVADPRIVRIGRSDGLGPSAWKPDAKATYIGITFNSTQFGILNARTGEFTDGGRD